MAIRLGVTNAVQLYVAKVVDLNSTDDGGMSPLMYAADAGQAQICRVLLEARADPLQCNDEGRDAYFFALRNGSSDVVGILRRFLGNPPEEELEKTEAAHSPVDDSAFDHADRPPTYPNEGFYLTGWDEYSEAPPPTGDPMVNSAAGKIQSLISLHVSPDTDEDWSEIEIDLPNVDALVSSSDSQLQEGIRELGWHYDSINPRSQIYIVEIGGVYLTCHSEVFAKYQASLRERAALSPSELNSLFRNIRADLDALNNAEPGRQTEWSVVEAIVCRQQDFLAKGPKHLKPMMLKDIADEVGINNSTASRIVNRIRARTPQGMVLLRSLFAGSILNESGEEISTQAIKQRVKELLMQESETTRVTDEQIVERLRNENIRIKRRTVAKYRQQLAILGSRERARSPSVSAGSKGIGKNRSHLKAKSSSKEAEKNQQPQESKPGKKRIEEMGEGYFREAAEAMGAREYERAIVLLHATILCGYRPAESLYQCGRAHLEIVSQRVTTLSPKECKGEDIKHHLTGGIHNFNRAIKLEPDLIDAYFSLGIAYALSGDKDSAFRQKTVLERLDSSAAAQLALSLDSIFSRNRSS
jgi:DNA-binding MarR family transcriptional regulator